MHARRDKKLETAPCCHGIHAPRHVGLLRVQEWCGEVAGRMAWDSAYAWIDQLQLTNKPLLELAGIAVKQLMQTRNIGKLLVRAIEPVGLKVITRPPLQSGRPPAAAGLVSCRSSASPSPRWGRRRSPPSPTRPALLPGDHRARACQGLPKGGPGAADASCAGALRARCWRYLILYISLHSN